LPFNDGVQIVRITLAALHALIRAAEGQPWLPGTTWQQLQEQPGITHRAYDDLRNRLSQEDAA
jgi:hypothetical protein